MRSLIRISSYLQYWNKYTGRLHMCGCLSYASSKASNQKPLPNSNVKQRHPAEFVEFSKSKSYPTNMKLHGVKEENIIETDADKRKKYIAVTIAFGMFCFAFYAFFLSTYDLKFEELMTNTIPGYVDYMKKIDPNYEETIKILKQKRAQRNITTKSK